MTITERAAVTAALLRALALSPGRAEAVAVVAQATALPEETVAECLPRCRGCQAVLSPTDEHYNDGRCDACEGEASEDVADLIDAGQPLRRLAHLWDDDGCCAMCGADGAEIWHLNKFAGYEKAGSERERRARLEDHRA